MMFIMASMGRKETRPRRSFTAEFKAEIVELCQRGDRSVGQIARDFDLTETAVREWLKQTERVANTRTDGLTASMRCGGVVTATAVPVSVGPAAAPRKWASCTAQARWLRKCDDTR
jgi:transposase-like protein